MLAKSGEQIQKVRIPDRGAEASGLFRGALSTRTRWVLGAVFVGISVLSSLVFPWSSQLVAAHIVLLLAFGFLGIVLVVAASFRKTPSQ